MTDKPFVPRNTRPTNPATLIALGKLELRDLPTDRLAELDERMAELERREEQQK